VKLLPPNIITSLLKHAIDNELPYSMVRLGDGEWVVIKYPKFDSLQKCKDRINRWFDSDLLNNKQIISIRNQIHAACINADILGIPSQREMNIISKWKRFIPIGKALNILSKKQKLFHFYTVQQIDYKKLLADVDEVYCITCRDIRDQLKKKFELKKVNMFLLPPEDFIWNPTMRRHNKTINRTRHYPEMFEKIMQHIKSHNIKGKVFLIGAGGLGKSYCNHVKRNGGIGIDVGALFDGWAGFYSRPFLKNPERFKL